MICEKSSVGNLCIFFGNRKFKKQFLLSFPELVFSKKDALKIKKFLNENYKEDEEEEK